MSGISGELGEEESDWKTNKEESLGIRKEDEDWGGVMKRRKSRDDYEGNSTDNPKTEKVWENWKLCKALIFQQFI